MEILRSTIGLLLDILTAPEVKKVITSTCFIGLLQIRIHLVEGFGAFAYKQLPKGQQPCNQHLHSSSFLCFVFGYFPLVLLELVLMLLLLNEHYAFGLFQITFRQPVSVRSRL